ncbi:MAG: hypothetical protein ACM4D3_11795 [Candidatus Sericytochromatia bacterium]
MPQLADLRKQPVVVVAAGAAATVGGGAVTAYRACEQVPVVGFILRRARSELARRGEEAITRSTEPLKTLVAAVATDLVRLVLAQLDLTQLVREAVDIDAIVSDVDIDAIVDRLDLIGLANQVIDGVDLPAIIRESTDTVTAEVITDVRTQSERADDMVSGLVDRMLGRDRETR